MDERLVCGRDARPCASRPQSLLIVAPLQRWVKVRSSTFIKSQTWDAVENEVLSSGMAIVRIFQMTLQINPSWT
jgi:hypothetical protein